MPMTQELEIPYLSQTDNNYEPFSACNVTSLAMALKYCGIEGDGSYSQLEDEIYHRAQQYGWNRFSPHGLKEICESYGAEDDLTTDGTLADIREAIEEDKPVIVHGFSTEPGHLWVIKGFDEDGFWVHDPYGELMAGMGSHSWYYQVNGNGMIYGENLHYSDRLIAATCGSWSYGQAHIMYNELTDSEMEGVENMWVHRIR
ncbi:MAG: C39 family peptidase [Okeania sp. SIO3H1]|uniref:C39 family peptidase n=1 Tax=Okeania sp. SIO1I7 TaxID=2607772 RepID=UPI0013CB2FAF|nr:C39 family peptidase [Okeania sp. SIO1I7]NEN92563.1 C39 family peptidase [Okeania sp. SIO3H1]NET30325.1 C39 family peptidase [Okeania sp. SIO1I7]